MYYHNSTYTVFMSQISWLRSLLKTRLEKGKLPNSFYNARTILIIKVDKDNTEIYEFSF